MRVVTTELPGVIVIEPTAHVDSRGYFVETWNDARYAQVGAAGPFVQDNMSFSRTGVLRGLHLQHPHDQAKLVSVLVGEVFDVAVDVRRGSPTFGRWVGRTLSAENRHQLFIPVGFAHGFVVSGAEALVTYKVTKYHEPESALTIAWDDPDLGIDWGVSAPTLSERDREAPRLRDVAPERLPLYGAAATHP